MTQEANKLRNGRYSTMKRIRSMNVLGSKMPYYDPSDRKLRILYVRYADDWIILSNADAQICASIKRIIKTFLWNSCNAILSDEKTVITDMRTGPAHFLGFGLRAPGKGRFLYESTGVGRVRLMNPSGLLVRAYPDTQRLINRMHSKGFCEVDGFPKSVTWLTNLDV